MTQPRLWYLLLSMHDFSKEKENTLGRRIRDVLIDDMIEFLSNQMF